MVLRREVPSHLPQCVFATRIAQLFVLALSQNDVLDVHDCNEPIVPQHPQSEFPVLSLMTRPQQLEIRCAGLCFGDVAGQDGKDFEDSVDPSYQILR
jgi:hypothetical protein